MEDFQKVCNESILGMNSNALDSYMNITSMLHISDDYRSSVN